MLAREDCDVRVALVSIFGQAFADHFVTGARSVQLRAIRAPDSERRNKLGHRYPGPRSVAVPFAPHPLRSANHSAVRRQARALVYIAGWMRPGAPRTGHPEQAHKLNLPWLAGRIGLKDERELQRYLATFEALGILRRWQPPQHSGAPKGPSGHCFNLYALQSMPPELERALAQWHKDARTVERAEVRALAQGPRSELPAVDGSDSALAFVRSLSARAAPS